MNGLPREPCWQNTVPEWTFQCDCEAVLDRGCGLSLMDSIRQRDVAIPNAGSEEAGSGSYVR